MATRVVTDTLLRGTGLPYANEPVSFYLREGAFTESATYPPDRVDTTTDSNGAYSQALWVNSDGLTPSEWVAIYPNKESVAFVLPPGASAVTMAELRAQAAWDWYNDPVPTAIDLERARYANTASSTLGSVLIGYLAAIAGAVGRTLRDRLRDRVSLLDFIPAAEHDAIRAGTSTYDCAAAMNAATTGDPKLLDIPPGTYRLLSTWTIGTAVTIRGEGATIQLIAPTPAAAAIEYLRIDASNVHISGLILDGSLQPNGAPLGSDDKARRAIRVNGSLSGIEPTLQNVIVERCRFVACQFIGSNHKTINPGAPVASGVHHGVYATGVRNLRVIECSFPTVSGAGVFVTNCIGVWLQRNYCDLVGYYPLHIDDSVADVWITDNEFGPLSYPDKGGLIDVMGYARQFPCRNGHILNNVFRGRGRYGAVLRVNGVENLDVAGNIFDTECTTQQMVKLGAREVEDEDFSGPCQNVTVSRNIFICRGHFDSDGELMAESGLCALDIRNEHSSIEAQNYQIVDNLFLADGTSATPPEDRHWFAAGIRLGVGGALDKSAIHHIEIARNLIEFRWTDTTATTGGIVVTGAYPDEPFTEITIHHNRVKHDPDAVIGTSVRGIYLAQNTIRSRIEHNTIENCYHPVRVAAAADNTLNDSECNTDINTPVGGQQIIGPEDMPADDTTPSLASCRRWRTSSDHTAECQITGFRGGVPGRLYYIQAGTGTHKTILVDNTGGTPSTLYLNGNWDTTVSIRLTLHCLTSTEFQELSRN